MYLPMPSFVSHSSILIARSVDLVVAHDDVVINFHSGYFDCRGSFQTVVNLYCCVMGLVMQSSIPIMLRHQTQAQGVSCYQLIITTPYNSWSESLVL